jgi:hypothetical protein
LAFAVDESRSALKFGGSTRRGLGAHRLVRLVAARHLRVLNLRTEKNLDALEVDDQIRAIPARTGRVEPVGTPESCANGSYFCGTGVSTLNIAPCGSVKTADRPTDGMSNGPTGTCPPCAAAVAAVASASATAK